MNKAVLVFVIFWIAAVACPQTGLARGFGGARGGGGYSGSREGGYSGNHYSGSHEGSYSRDGGYSGSREGSYSGNHYSGSHEGSYSRDSGYSGSREGSYSGNHYSGSHEGGYSRGSGYSGSREGSYSGANYSGSHEGSYNNGSFSGSRQGTYSGANYNGSHQSTYGGTVEGHASYGTTGYRGGANYAAVGYRGVDGAGANAAIPTDGGFAAAGAAAGTRNMAGYNSAHMTQPVNSAYAAARGAAVTNSFNHPGMFGEGWYGAHPGAWQATGWAADRPWAAAAWPTIGVAVGMGVGVAPISYNYGSNISYQGNQVYSDGQPVATADEYYQQAADLAQAVPAPSDDNAEWMPLGTFGLVRHEESDPSYVIQLAVDKTGAVAGNYCDMLTDHNLPVHGSVDRQTQKLAWTVGDNTKVVGEVGLYNLTQSEAPALIHIGKDKTQQWLLVRLKQPGAAEPQ